METMLQGNPTNKSGGFRLNGAMLFEHNMPVSKYKREATFGTGSACRLPDLSAICPTMSMNLLLVSNEHPLRRAI